MGTYISQAELKARFENDEEVAKLTRTEDSSGLPDSTILDEVIDGVESEMESYIGMRYQVPVDVTSANLANHQVLRKHGLAMCVWELVGGNQNAHESIRTMYEDAIRWLEAIASGEAVLPQPSTAASTVSRDGIGVVVSGDDDSSSSKRLFTRDRMANV
jgi:phage gp36-like protein